MKKFINEKYPHFIHGADYNPEQWKKTKEIWDEDMRLMNKANCNEMTMGMFSWAQLEPNEDVFDFSFLDEIIEKIAKNGGKVVFATPSGARPHWLAEKYPEVLRVNEQGVRMHFGARHNHCYTSPAYREKIRKINGLLAQRYGNNDAVVVWHISNEYGGACYCPLCQDAFRAFLKERYQGDIEKLNDAYWSTFWSHTYDNFEQIEAPSPISELNIHGLNLDWKRFISHQTLDFMKWEIQAIREFDKTTPVTTNMMPWFYDLNYNEFAQHLDIASWDNYPDWHSPKGLRSAIDSAFWHDYFRSMKNRPFMLMESAPGAVNWKAVNKLKRPNMDTLEAMQAVAHGSDTVQYFQWRKSRGSAEKFHGAVVDHVGTEETRVFKAVQETGRVLKAIDEIAGTGVESRVAILFDWENAWALKDSQFALREKGLEDTCLQYYAPLWKRGISVDIIGVERDFSKYDLIIAPMLYMTSKQTIDKIETYVKNGGTIYATYMLGMVNETDLCYLGGYPAENLKEVFGIWNEEIDALYPNERGEVETENGVKFETKDLAEIIHLRGAKVLAKYSKEFYQGAPAYTVNEYGKGRAYYQAFRDTGEFSEYAIESIVESLNIPRALNVELPNGVSAHARTDGQNEYIFIENYTDTQQKINLKKSYLDLLTGKSKAEIILSSFGFVVLKK